MTERDAWSSEGLRRAALEALGALADERAVDALVHGDFAVTPAAARWDASAGPVEAHRVTLALDARRLGTLRAAPGVVDALCAAVAAAVATRAGQSLLELALRWAPGARAATMGYRDAPPPPVTLREGLVEYLDALGERSLASAAAGAHLDAEDPSEVLLLVDRATFDALRSDAHAHTVLTRALRDLLGRPDVRVREQSDRP